MYLDIEKKIDIATDILREIHEHGEIILVRRDEGLYNQLY